MNTIVIYIWLVVWTPLKNISQLGWWNSQYMGKCQKCSKPPTSLYLYLPYTIEFSHKHISTDRYLGGPSCKTWWFHGGYHEWRSPQKCLVFIMDNRIKMDDELGYPHFLENSHIVQYWYTILVWYTYIMALICTNYITVPLVTWGDHG